MINYQKLSDESIRLSEEIALLKKQIEVLPKGSIHCHSDGKWFCVYEENPRKRYYIPKSKREFAEKLALKKLKIARLRDATDEKNAIDRALHLLPKERRVDVFFQESEAHRDLVKEYYQPREDDFEKWAQEYERNPNHPEKLKVKTPLGYKVRSKSEYIIASLLYKYGIYFRYEGAFQVGDVTIYPDFMIMHPVTGEIFIWEHFGIADQESYATNIELKLRTYRASGYYPMINLITTYETKDEALDYELVETLIKHFFLNT